MMKPRLVIWLCILVACSSENAVTPVTDGEDADPALMTATMWDKPFYGMAYCDGGAGPPAAPPSFWAKRTADDARFDADLTGAVYRSGRPSPLGYDTKLYTGTTLYVLRDQGSGTVSFTRFDDTEITGSIDATLVQQRDVTKTIRFVATFSADPFMRTASVTGTMDGVPFQSDVGEEYFPRARASVCIGDTAFSDGTGAEVAITVDRICPTYPGSYPIFSTHGPAIVTVQSGGEFYNGVSGSLDVLGVDSVAVEDSLGAVIRYNRIITDARFDFVGVNLIVFGDENKDTVRVNGGELSLSGPLPSP